VKVYKTRGVDGHRTAMLRVLWLYRGETPPWQVDSYMDVDTPLGEKIAAVCAVMRWREKEWQFELVWIEANERIDKARTPRSYGYDNFGSMVIECVPAEVNN
jgi:hypothetical protein